MIAVEAGSSSAIPRLAMRGISKSFGGMPVLRDVDMEVAPGEVHGLVGQNGAGKSTLTRILAGSYQNYRGSIWIDGESVVMRSPREALKHGVAVIYQELSLVDTMTVAENIVLGAEPGTVRLNRGAIRTDARRLLENVGMAGDVPLDAVVGSLSAAMREYVEIAKALTKNAKVLVLDEPTARLPEHERVQLASLIKRIAERGTGVIFISHILDEILDVASRVTVLRDGRVVESRSAGDFHVTSLSAALLGETKVAVAKNERRGSSVAAEVVLLASSLSGGYQVRDVSFALHRGEIIGLAGLVGSGRTTLARLLVGATTMTSGSVEYRGRIVRFRSPGQALRSGIVLVPGDRQEQGVFGQLSAADNLTLMMIGARGTRFGHVGYRSLGTKVADAMDNFEVHPSNSHRAASTFSGGNQQKLLLARAMLAQPTVLVVDQPTAGVDVGTKAQIYNMLHDVAAAGNGILVISDDLDEVLALSDRVLVMRLGRVVEAFDRDAMSREAVLDLLTVESRAA